MADRASRRPVPAQDRLELVAVGSPSDAASLITRNLRRRGCVVGLPLLVLAAISYVIASVSCHCHHGVGTTQTALNSIRSATVLFRNGHPSAPCPTVKQLKAEGLLDRPFPERDPWGNAFHLQCNVDEITAWTNGPDHRPGTQDDIYAPPRDLPRR